VERVRARRWEGEEYMPSYIILVNWTDQGIRNVRGTLERTGDVAKLAEKHGGKLVQTYWTVGPYDVVGIAEAPDDESATAIALELGSAGNVRTTTMRAYDHEEMSGILQRLG
jgi:uncharacterized protein with GYD domain